VKLGNGGDINWRAGWAVQWKLGGGSSLKLIMKIFRFVPWAGIEDESPI
jgi:hypothetical protein